MLKKYNFAFFGLSGSGKTCILAALDMQRVEHPAGYTCSLLPVTVKRPVGEPEKWTDEEKEADILYKSSDRLEEAKQELEQGTVPRGTELTIDFMFDYKFSSPKIGEFCARLMDYGGELVNPNNAPQDIAKELREKLRGMDGIFVLAPVPFPNDIKQGKTEKLNRLQKTLGLIQFRQTIPIALLVTKWDRIAALPSSILVEPLNKDELPSIEHRDLYNDLVNKVGEDNCKAFPISAFGESERQATEDGKERELPKQVNPLMSFGLLEGFIWLTQRLQTIKSQRNAIRLQNDIIELQNYEQTVARYKAWFPYPSLSLWHLKRIGKEIINLFPKHSEQAKRAKQALHRCSKIWLLRLVVLPFVFIGVLLLYLWTSQAYEDKKSYDEVHSTLNAPNADFEEIQKAEQWLENYYYTTPLWHPISWLFVVSNGTAKSELDKSRHLNEQRFWQAIQQATSLVNKREAAKAYIKVLPNGLHIAEVEVILTQTEEILRQKLEQQWWQAVEQAPSVTAKLKAARAYLKALPNGEHKAETNSLIVQAEETLLQEKEQRLWLAVTQAETDSAKITAGRHYQEAFPNGQHRAELLNIIVPIEDALREQEEQRLWQPVLEATFPRTQKEAAQNYLQEKPNGRYAIEAKNRVLQAETRLHEGEEQRWWLPVKQAISKRIQVEKARAYLEAMPLGKHAAEADGLIAEYDYQKEWLAFQTEYYELFNESLFLEAALHLSQRQSKNDPNLQTLKRQFLANIFNSLETQNSRLISSRKWFDAYEILDNYGNWPAEFQDMQKRAKVRTLRKKVQEAKDRYLYLSFFEARDVERADNYLRSAPLHTMRDKVKAYKKYLIEIKNPLKLELILARIEWGDLDDDDNIVTVFLDGKKIIEKTKVNAEKNDYTEEIGRVFFEKKLNTMVTLKVRIIEDNWLSSSDDNGQASRTLKVEQLDGLILNLRPPSNEFTNKAVLRLKGMPSEPHLPDWGG
ncbi:MAG: hypothetical protein DRR16_17275 [Candidatus Parabeggiatoa sp. nov. 3]|nr:MAG: hypothetical protein DRR00_14575 [Gammaproteobacteria bacterium]RKZ66024.1 MAG: hypothetical protein DRQ99_10955 [Gammaproteobacteria bacterium]RKZ83446.1 MAG: hypothetical protein DRR16_17275 [Gammaproteobacteria bacterium]